MVQMIALDLDGTLLQPDSTLSAAAEDALTKAISQGICIVVASGRAFTALPEKIRHFAGIRYAVTSNGAAVSELPAGKLLCAWTLPEQAVLDLLKMQQAAGTFLIEAGIGGQMYAPEEYLNNPVFNGIYDRIDDAEYVRNLSSEDEQKYQDIWTTFKLSMQ